MDISSQEFFLVNDIAVISELHVVSIKRFVEERQHLRLILVGIKVLELRAKVLILLILVLREIWAVEIKQAMTELVAGYSFDSQPVIYQKLKISQIIYLRHLVVLDVSEHWKAFRETETRF